MPDRTCIEQEEYSEIDRLTGVLYQQVDLNDVFRIKE